MSHSVYERCIIGHMLDSMTIEQLRAELTRADKVALYSVGHKHIVDTSHVIAVRNHLIRRG